jgi:hypothetical protein
MSPVRPLVPLRLSFPVALATAGGGDFERCTPFLDAVAAMTRADWLALGSRLWTDSPAGRVRAAVAAERVDDVVAARRLGVTAWLVRDAVETAAQVALGARPGGRSGGGWSVGRRESAPPSAPEERPLLAAARQGAERAALAHLVRPWLPREHFLMLVAPLVVPLAAAE